MKRLAIISARNTPSTDKRVMWYKVYKWHTPCDLPYICELYNKDNICIYKGAFSSQENAEAYAQDRIDMTTPLY